MYIQSPLRIRVRICMRTGSFLQLCILLSLKQTSFAHSSTPHPFPGCRQASLRCQLHLLKYLGRPMLLPSHMRVPSLPPRTLLTCRCRIVLIIELRILLWQIRQAVHRDAGLCLTGWLAWFDPIYIYIYIYIYSWSCWRWLGDSVDRPERFPASTSGIPTRTVPG